MPKAVWYDPDRASAMERALSADGLTISEVLAEILSLRSQRGHPAVEFVRDHGTALSIATDGERAYLVWVNSLGETFHCVGTGPGTSFVFDYCGSWSEAPGDDLVALRDAVASAEAFMRVGVPDTASVIFTPE